MRNIQIDGEMRRVYREEEYWASVGAGENPQGDDILVARPCVICGDQLLGTVASLYDVEKPKCKRGHHGSRPGVYY